MGDLTRESGDSPGYPLPCLGVIEPPPRVCSKEGGEAVPRTYGPWPRGAEAVDTGCQRDIAVL